MVIIGTGFGGIAAAVKLLQQGVEDFIMLERSQEVGGVWRDNHYPGCACDVQSHLFSFSFFANPNWSRSYSGQAEIHQYLKDCTNAFGLINHIRFQHEVREMDWIEKEGEWEIHTSKGVFRASIVVGAFGVLSDPMIPQIKGIEHFKGDTFHSATWPKDFSPKEKRIAVVGTGASAIQFIPEIQPAATSLHVFQRTPPWVLPRLDEPISLRTRKWYERIPLLQKGTRLKIYLQRELLVMGFRNPEKIKKVEETALKHIHRAIEDPILRKKLTPNYTIGCKRILLSNTYYPALAQSNVKVNTTGIREVTEDSVIDCDGNKIDVDTIIFGTGFQVKDLPLAHHIYGRVGHSLAQEWNGSPQAYMGTMVAGFPNLFLLQGPNTGLGHSSVIVMIEAQVKHMIKTMKHMKKNNLDIIEPTKKAQERFVKSIDKFMEGTVWTAGGCKSWYLDKAGRNSTLWPGYTFSYRRLVSNLSPNDFVGRRVLD